MVLPGDRVHGGPRSRELPEDASVEPAGVIDKYQQVPPGRIASPTMRSSTGPGSRTGSPGACDSAHAGTGLREGPDVALQVAGRVGPVPVLADRRHDLRAMCGGPLEVRVEIVHEQPGNVRAWARRRGPGPAGIQPEHQQ